MALLESRAWPAPANPKLSNPMNTAFDALQGAESLLLAAIRVAYGAGVLAGLLFWPVIHGLAAAAKWTWANIDWTEVALAIRAGLIALVHGLPTQWLRRLIVWPKMFEPFFAVHLFNDWIGNCVMANTSSAFLPIHRQITSICSLDNCFRVSQTSL